MLSINVISITSVLHNNIYWKFFFKIAKLFRCVCAELRVCAEIQSNIFFQSENEITRNYF